MDADKDRLERAFAERPDHLRSAGLVIGMVVVTGLVFVIVVLTRACQ